MTYKEVNKIIIQYMKYEKRLQSTFKYGRKNFVYYDPNNKNIAVKTNFTSSIDALVPVWEKLDLNNRNLEISFFIKDLGDKINFLITAEAGTQHGGSVGLNTLQQAAAHATAKLILELKNENKKS